MTTVKELVWKAYEDATKLVNKDNLEIRFESWWSEWYARGDHRDSFKPKHDIYIDGKRYIQVE